MDKTNSFFIVRLNGNYNAFAYTKIRFAIGYYDAVECAKELIAKSRLKMTDATSRLQLFTIEDTKLKPILSIADFINDVMKRST